MPLSSSAAVNIYADESKNKNFYFLSLVYTSPSYQDFWACAVKESLDKEGIKEMHGQDLATNGRAQRAAFSILTKMKMQWNQYGSYQKHPLGYCVLAIKRDKLKERQHFGSEQRESNMHRRFLRTAIQYSLKKFYDISEDNQLSMFHFYHDENSNLEQNQLLISKWMLQAIVQDCGYCLNSFSQRIEFISSNAQTSGTNASYLIQVADMIAWLLQRGMKEASSSPQDEGLTKLFYLWKKEFLPSMLVDRAELYHNKIIHRETRAQLFIRSKVSHLSCFPDENGKVYRPKTSDFSY